MEVVDDLRKSLFVRRFLSLLSPVEVREIPRLFTSSNGRVTWCPPPPPPSGSFLFRGKSPSPEVSVLPAFSSITHWPFVVVEFLVAIRSEASFTVATIKRKEESELGRLLPFFSLFLAPSFRKTGRFVFLVFFSLSLMSGWKPAAKINTINHVTFLF